MLEMSKIRLALVLGAFILISVCLSTATAQSAKGSAKESGKPESEPEPSAEPEAGNVNKLLAIKSQTHQFDKTNQGRKLI